MLLLALDQGTTSSRAILFDKSGRQVAMAQRELTQIFPQPGWVEHDPREIWRTQLETARQAIARANARPGDIASIGITNQRETAILWDRATGEPLCNAIVWQDRRTADFCQSLRQGGREGVIQQKTGLVADAYFSASKIKWMLDHLPGARDRAQRGELAFGTVDAWLLWNLTAGAPITGGSGGHEPPVHATDVSNASRTMLLNLHTGTWDEELLELFGIPRAILPEVRPSCGRFGVTHLLGAPIPIAGMAGDQQAALFGQACTTPGLAKNTYGTGCFLLMNTGESAPASRNKLLTTIAWQFASQQSPAANQPASRGKPPAGMQASKLTYALEGSVFVGGAVVQWLRDGLGIIKSSSEIEALAASVPDAGGIYLVPAFAGLGAPHWDQYARGIIAGITRGTTAAHLARAALESIAFQVADLLDVMHADAHAPIRELRVDGGASKNDLLLQFQADLLQMPVVRPRVTETTALGAAFLAGLGEGVYGSVNELGALWERERTFVPAMSADAAGMRRSRWAQALSRAREWEPSA